MRVRHLSDCDALVFKSNMNFVSQNPCIIEVKDK